MEEVVIHQIVNPCDSTSYIFRSPYKIKDYPFIISAVGGSLEELKLEQTDDEYIGLIRCPNWSVNPSIINIKVKVKQLNP